MVETVHATAIAVGGRAVLIRGASGTGKSDLALRCLAVLAPGLFAESARLVSDDQAVLTPSDERLIVSAPTALYGKIEVRGVGIVHITQVTPEADVVLIADITGDEPIERFPLIWQSVEIAGFTVPKITIRAFEASAPLKLIMALTGPDLPKVRKLG